jgi:cellulose synthase/poly-beta-1,6-N-acetylglucosamine synthase-like glycosyltransferase
LADSTLVQQFFDYFWLYFPLGIIGVYRWSVWGFKYICARFYEPIHVDIPNYYSSFSIITPVYNEDPALFENALLSWEASNPDELIAVIDVRDTPCIEVFKRFAVNRPWAKLVITPILGKRPALVEGIRKAKGNIVALVDSDVIWSQSVKERMLAPFKYPEIGGVAVKQNAISSNFFFQKIADMLWDSRNYLDWPSQAAMGKALTCLSGRTAVYRRHILLPLLDEFVNETIFGRRKDSGEDKCLTRLVQREGWKTYYQSTVQIYTMAYKEFKTLWNQKIRWTRNTYNSDITSMVEGWIWKKRYLAFFVIDKFISLFTLLIGPIAFGIALYLNHWIIVLSILALWLVGRGIKLIPHLRNNPKDIWTIPAYVLTTFSLGIAKLYALVTIRDQEWIRPKSRHERRKLLIKRIKNIFLTAEIISVMVIIMVTLTQYGFYK